MLRISPLLALAAASTLATVPAQGATRAHVPTGKYRCQYLDESTMGDITIKSASAYAYNSRKVGKYRLSGTKITFLSGPMKGVYQHAKLVRKPGRAYIQLYDKSSFGHSTTDANCLKTAS